MRDALLKPGNIIAVLAVGDHFFDNGKKNLDDDLFCHYQKNSPTASTALILPGLKIVSLISIDQLCDDDCDVYLNKQILIVVKER